jgi:hypothetical protein
MVVIDDHPSTINQQVIDGHHSVMIASKLLMRAPSLIVASRHLIDLSRAPKHPKQLLTFYY